MAFSAETPEFGLFGLLVGVDAQPVVNLGDVAGLVYTFFQRLLHLLQMTVVATDRLEVGPVWLFLLFLLPNSHIVSAI